MDVEATEFQDWEILNSNPGSDSELLATDSFDEIGTQKEGLIQANYFSIDSASESKYVTTITGAVERDEVSEKLGNPSWVDPGSENWVSNKDSGELDSDSERSEDRKFGDYESKTEVGVVENPELQVGFEGIEEIGSENWVSNKDSGEFLLDSDSERSEDRKFGDFEGKTEVGVVENPELQVGFEGIQEIGGENGETLEVCDSGGIGIGLDEVKFEDLEVNNMLKFGEINTNFEDGSEVYIEEKQESEKRNEIIEVERRKAEEKKMSLVWWKVPLELLKYCFSRVSPMWTFHMAAAVMGFVILGRRLYKMKKKAKALELKVTADDEKVSQFMSRAARLNEAFSVVKRVPVIQPQLPAAGVTQWPVMSLR